MKRPKKTMSKIGLDALVRLEGRPPFISQENRPHGRISLYFLFNINFSMAYATPFSLLENV